MQSGDAQDPFSFLGIVQLAATESKAALRAVASYRPLTQWPLPRIWAL